MNKFPVKIKIAFSPSDYDLTKLQQFLDRKTNAINNKQKLALNSQLSNLEKR